MAYMVSTGVRFWCDLYRKYKYSAVALDIETESYDGSIAVLSVSRLHGTGVTETIQLTKGQDLSERAIADTLKAAKLLITFNGLNFDLPKLTSEYPESFSEDIPVLDLYILAQAIGFKGGLKVLEKVLNVPRSTDASDATGHTHKLWKQFISENDQQALQSLLDYAAADASNLFKLADTLIEWAEAKLTVQEKQQQAGVNLQNANWAFSFEG